MHNALYLHSGRLSLDLVSLDLRNPTQPPEGLQWPMQVFLLHCVIPYVLASCCM